jgi:hypothetical protein
VRARPARGYAALIVLLMAAAETARAEAPAAVRGEVAQPAAVSEGLGFELGIPALEARVKKLESGALAREGIAEALREYDAAIGHLQKARRMDSPARLQSEGEALPQRTRTEIEAWSKPVAAPVPPHSSQPEAATS